MKLPEEFLQSLEGLPGYHRQEFVAVHEREEGVTSIRLNPEKWSGTSAGVTEPGDGNPSALTVSRTPVPWTTHGFYLAARPSFTFDPFFHAGCYYVQEASSMFLEQALLQLADLSVPLKVLDLCAAPGGKTTHLLSLLHKESLLVANEVIRQRSVVLTDNIIKWGCAHAMVTNNDPKAFQNLPGCFDVMVVDAPCSGSGLFRKDADAIAEWSLNNVAICSQRQQRILADALPALKEGGLLIYSTCSYSAAEDEAIIDWLVLEMDMENIPLQVEAEWGITITTSKETNATGYRFYPDKLKGEGFFMACFRKLRDDGSFNAKPAKPELISAREKKAMEGWIKPEELEFLRFRNTVMALPTHLLPHFLSLPLNIQYAGVAVGEVMKEKLVPAHALSQNLLLHPGAPSTDLSYEDAIRYLQRQDLATQPETPGWQVVRYGGKPLGWINALKNRVNNYYPKEIRILKQNNKGF